MMNSPLNCAGGENKVAASSNKTGTDHHSEIEEAYRTLIEHSLQGLLIFQHGRVVLANPVATSITGYTTDELLSLSLIALKNLLHPDERDEVWRTVHAILSGREVPWSSEQRIIRKCGEVRRIETHFAHVRWRGRAALQVVGIDITSHRQAEESLRDSEQMFRTVADFTCDWEYWLEPGGRFLYVSPSCEAITGYLPQEFLADASLLNAIVHPDDRSRVAAHHREHVEEEPGKAHAPSAAATELEPAPETVLEFRIITRGGEERWIEHVGQSVYDAAGHWLGRRASNRDITRRKRMEAEICQMNTELERRVLSRTRELQSFVDELWRRNQELQQMYEILHYYGLLIESVSDAIISFDLNFFIQSWNKAAEMMYGWRAEEAIGISFFDLLRPQFLGTSREEVRRHFFTHGTWEGEVLHYCRDGTAIYVFVRGSLLYDSEGRHPTGTVSVNHNITQRREAEQALQASEARFRTLVETAPVAIFIEQMQRGATHLVYINPTAEKLLGYSLEELSQKYPCPAAHPDSFNLVNQRLQAYQQGTEIPVYELKVVTKERQVRWLDVTTTRIDFEGQPSFLLVAIDRTEERQAREARQQAYIRLEEVHLQLRHNHTLLQTIINSIEDGLLLLDSSGMVLEANQAMSSLLGRPREELWLRSWLHICRPDRRNKGQADARSSFPGLWVLQTLHDGKTRQQREHFTSPDGRQHVLDMRVYPIVYEDRQHEPGSVVDRVVLHVVDVTEQVQLEMVMIENMRLSTSSKLVATVAHEVNTPLQTILTSLLLLRRASKEQRERFLNLAQEEIERIGTILEDLKDLYRVEPEGDPEQVNINTVVERVLQLAAGKMVKQHIHVRHNLAEGLPPVRGHRGKLTQVFLNLVINAVDAMPRGGLLRIRTRTATSSPANGSPPPSPAAPAETKDECGNDGHAHRATANTLIADREREMDFPGVIVEIADTGEGIDPDIQMHIFDPFFTTRESGSGLGLAVVRTIVAKHGGVVSVRSQPGEGSIFTVRLPVHAPGEE